MKYLLCLLTFAAVAQAEVSLRRDGAYWVQTVSGSAPFSAAAFRVNTVGAVTLRGDERATASYTLRKRVRARSEAEATRLLSQVRSRMRPDGLVVTQPLHHPAWVDLELVVPRRVRNVSVITKGGNLTATDLDGNLVLESGGGNLLIDRIRGGVSAKTGGGEIRAGVVGGPLRSFSAGGSIRAGRVGGEAWLETAGGEIHVGETAGAVHASTAGGNIHVQKAGAYVTAHTSGGRIEVQNALGLVNAENSGGSIDVGAAQGVRVEASGGAIRLRGASGSLRAATDFGNILAELIPGVALTDAVLSAGDGDVTVMIPSNFPVTVKALNEKGRSARIVSDFPEFAPRRTVLPVVAEGCVNGCGPVLRISASGTIYLRRQR